MKSTTVLAAGQLCPAANSTLSRHITQPSVAAISSFRSRGGLRGRVHACLKLVKSDSGTSFAGLSAAFSKSTSFGDGFDVPSLFHHVNLALCHNNSFR
jgi:hypothetical protein